MRKGEKEKGRERERKTEGGRERMKEREIERERLRSMGKGPTGGNGSHRYREVPVGRYRYPFSSGAQKRTTGGRYRWGGTGGEVPVGRYQWGGTGGEGLHRWGRVTPVGEHMENHDLSKKDSVPVGPFLKSHRWGKRASYSLLQPNF